MPLPFRPNCQPTSLGLLPHADVAPACTAMLRYSSCLPTLPLLAGAGEAPELLAADGFAGATVGSASVTVDRHAARRGVDALYVAYLRGAANAQPVELATLSWMLHPDNQPLRRARGLFGLVLGPVSLGQALVDEQADPVLNDHELVDALAKHVYLRRLWLHKQLERVTKPVIVWLYEPYLVVLESPFRPLPAEILLEAVDQALGYELLRALWVSSAEAALLLPESWPLDVLGMPLPMPEQATTVGPMIARLVSRRTAFGWGLVPVTAEGLRGATAGRLAARFTAWLRALEAVGIAPDAVVAASLIMPEDTLVDLDPADAERALALTVELSSLIQQSYGVE